MDGKGNVKWNVAEVVLCMQKRNNKRKTQEDKPRKRKKTKKTRKEAERKRSTRETHRARQNKKRRGQRTRRNKARHWKKSFFWRDVLNMNQNLHQKGPPPQKMITFHIFQNTGDSKNVMLKLVSFNLHSFRRQIVMLQEATKLQIRQKQR